MPKNITNIKSGLKIFPIVVSGVARNFVCGGGVQLDIFGQEALKFGRMYFDLPFCVKSVKRVKSVKLKVGNPL